jgi:serine/threonine protein kinase/tetratricopeptide (TPR) repeat protein
MVDETQAALRSALGDRYDVIRTVGRGGMATVYLARDLKHNRPVAIKALDPMLSLAPGRERFLREIEIVAGLNHPHILPLHDSGSAAGLIYFVMPFVEGESLRERLRRSGPLPITEALELAAEVADGLGYAHEQGVIHRDIKPENILLSAGHALIADFGIARAGSGRASQGVPIGTPEYMSPEQVAGDRPGPASDEYSLATVVHEMLSGQTPFSGPTAQAVLYRRLTSPPPSVRDCRPEVPDHVAQAILQALAREPAERFGSPVKFARALVKPEPGPPSGTRPAARAIVVLPFDNLSPDPADAFFADGLTEEVTAGLAKVPGLAVISRTTAMRYRGSGKDLPTIARELGVGYVLEGSVRRAGPSLRMTAQLVEGRTDKHLWAEQFTGTVDDVFAVQERLSSQIVEAMEVAFAPRGGATRRVPHPGAYSQYLKGRYFFGKRGHALLRAREAFEEAIRLDPGFAAAPAALAEAEVMLCWYLLERPGDGFPRARTAALRALELDPDLAMAHNALAFTQLWYDWDFPAARRTFERALALDPSYPTLHHWYGELLTVMGLHDEALQEARRAKGLDPLGLILSAMVAFACYFGRRFDEAVAETRQSLDMDPAFMPLYPWLVAALIGLGRYDEAITAGQDAAGITGDVSVVQPLLAVALARSGRAGEARALLARLEQLAASAPVSPIDLGVIHLALGDRDAALACLARGHEGRDVRMPLVRHDPLWDDARSDPRFAPLLP